MVSTRNTPGCAINLQSPTTPHAFTSCSLMMDGMNIEISGTSLLGDLGEPGRRRSSRILSQVLTPERSLSNTPSSKMKNPASVIDTPYSAANGHTASPYGGTDVSIPPRSLRNRTVDAKKEQVRQAVDEAMRPMSDKDRRHYKGWLELESDPVSPRCQYAWWPVHCVLMNRPIGSIQPCIAAVWGPRYSSPGLGHIG